jgi:hypothetical protein
MFNELIDRLQLVRNFTEYTRTYRLEKLDGFWYFHTREGIDVGPFTDRSDARYTWSYFSQRAEWPDKEELLAFKSGCEINTATKH